MAYVSAEKKAKINAALKGIIPKDWRWSLRVRHHSTLCLTIWAAPVDLIACLANAHESVAKTRQCTLHLNHAESAFTDEAIGKVFVAIRSAMNLDNHDNSDIYTDYFDVGHYTEVSLGRWDKAFQLLTHA